MSSCKNPPRYSELYPSQYPTVIPQQFRELNYDDFEISCTELQKENKILSEELTHAKEERDRFKKKYFKLEDYNERLNAELSSVEKKYSELNDKLKSKTIKFEIEIKNLRKKVKENEYLKKKVKELESEKYSYKMQVFKYYTDKIEFLENIQCKLEGGIRASICDPSPTKESKQYYKSLLIEYNTNKKKIEYYHSLINK